MCGASFHCYNVRCFVIVVDEPELYDLAIGLDRYEEFDRRTDVGLRASQVVGQIPEANLVHVHLHFIVGMQNLHGVDAHRFVVN